MYILNFIEATYYVIFFMTEGCQYTLCSALFILMIPISIQQIQSTANDTKSGSQLNKNYSNEQKTIVTTIKISHRQLSTSFGTNGCKKNYLTRLGLSRSERTCFFPSYKKSFMIVLKLEGFLVWLTKSELTHCLQNFIKITNRLHDVCETKK